MKLVTKHVKMYVCDICGRWYFSKEDCLNCESSHGRQTVQNVIKHEYKENNVYPDTIALLMSDGTIRKYKLMKG